MTASVADADGTHDCFRHEAWFYAGQDEFVEGAVEFVREGLHAEESVLVVVDAAKIERLRSALGDDEEKVLFADMAELGANPARLIPAWKQFVDRRPAGGARLRGIGEPVWPSRSPAELVECHRHEALLNLAFARTPAFWLRCPYDTAALDISVSDEAHRTHPMVCDHDGPRPSRAYGGLGAATDGLAGPLEAPPASAHELAISLATLSSLRDFAAACAGQVGFGPDRTAELVLVLSELASNSVLHGGGSGTLTIWPDCDGLSAEVCDRGRIDDPLVGREVPADEQEGGWGLWLVNQLCDLVQIRSASDGTTVRLHIRRDEKVSRH